MMVVQGVGVVDGRGSRGRWNGVVADIRRAGTGRGRALLGCYTIEGTRIHERALRAGAPVRRVVISETFRADPSSRSGELIEGLEKLGTEIYVAPDAVLDELTEGRSIGAVVGLVRLPEVSPTLASLARDGEGSVLFLVGVDVEDPGNVGALVRTALASGAAAFLSVGRGDPYHPRAVRTSMGSVVKLPLLRYATTNELLRDLRGCGATALGAVAHGGTRLDRLEDPGAVAAVLVGSEAFGLPDELITALDGTVTVPMASEVDSFSVHAAAAMILYEIRRGRLDPVA